MRALRYLLYAVGAVLLLLIVAAILIPLFVDINDYKDEIASAVGDKTGRELVIEGDLELSVFPWLRIGMGATRLGNAPGFGDEPFAAFERATVGVKLMPLLLYRRLEIGKAELNGLVLNLERAADGRTNWDDLAEAGQAAAAEPSEETGAAVSLDSIGGVELADAMIRWRDRQSGKTYTITNWDLETGALKPGEAFDVTTELALSGESLELEMTADARALYDAKAQQLGLTGPSIEALLKQEGQRIELRARLQELTAELGPQRFIASQPRLETKIQPAEKGAQPIEATIDIAELTADLSAQTLTLKGLAAKALGMEISGELSGEKIVDEPVISGPIRIAEFSPRKLLERFGTQLDTADPDVLKRAVVAANLRATDSSLGLNKLDAKLDDTKLTGRLRITDFEKSAVRFELDVDKIDLDRYMPPTTEGEQPAAEAAGDLPLEEIRALNVAGDLKVGEARFADMRFTDVALSLKAVDGKVRVHPSTAAFYDGRYEGDVRLDATGNAAVLSMNEKVTGIDFAAMTKDLADTGMLTGKANALAKLSARGKNMDELTRALKGDVSVELAGGAIEGFDLWYEIRRARALIEREPVPAAPQGPPRTPFKQFRGSARVDEGVARNDDLIVAMEYLRVTGDGVINIVEQQLDYDVKATVLDIPAEGSEPRTEELVDAVIPVKITGPLASPKVRPDLEAWLKARAKREINKKKEEVREKVEDKVKDKLKDLLNRDR